MNPHHPWATLRMNQSGLRATLREWYLDPQYELDDPVFASFDEHVGCVEVTESPPLYVDLSLYSPIKCAYLLFYTLNQYSREIRVLGGLSWIDIERMDGVIQNVSEHRRRGFIAPEVSSPPMSTVPIDFYFPCFFGQINELARYLQFPPNIEYGILQDCFAARLEWYRQAEQSEEGYYPRVFTTHIDPLIDSITQWLCMLMIDHIQSRFGRNILGFPFDGRRLRARYENMRYKAERYQLEQLFQGYTTEQSLIDLFKFNGLFGWLGNVTVDPTPLDEAWFIKQHPIGRRYFPEIYLALPLSDVLPEMAYGMAKYANGCVHVPLYAECILEVVWYRYVNEQQRLYTFGYEKHKILKSIMHWLSEPFFKELSIYMVRYMGITSEKRVYQRKLDPRMTVNLTIPIEGATIPDIEDIWSCMPPCVLAMRRKDFPRNPARIRLVPMARNAGLSKESIHDWLKDWNSRFPKAPPEDDLDRRINLEDLFKIQVKTGDPVKDRETIHYCTNVIKDTMMNNDETIKCPYARQHKGIVDSCRTQCRSESEPTARYLFPSPESLMRYKLRKVKNKGTAAVVEDLNKEEEIKKETSSSNSSSEESIEEEEEEKDDNGLSDEEIRQLKKIKEEVN